MRGFDLEGRLARPRGSNLEDFGYVFRCFWPCFRVHFRFSENAIFENSSIAKMIFLKILQYFVKILYFRILCACVDSIYLGPTFDYLGLWYAYCSN